MSVRHASQSFTLARVSHRAARVRLAVSFARVLTAKHLPLAEPSPSCAPWQRELGSSVATVVPSGRSSTRPLGQSVVGASHRRAAPRSQSVAGLASLHRRSLPLPVPRVAARPGRPLPSLRRWSLALPVPPSSRCRHLLAFEGQVPLFSSPSHAPCGILSLTLRSSGLAFGKPLTSNVGQMQNA